MAKEVIQGLVTVEGALNYGVVLTDGAVDAAATEALRNDIRDQRHGALPTFNYGASIDDLRKNSMAETGLPAPKPPVWKTRRTPELAEAAE